jgi:hypothetical protein
VRRNMLLELYISDFDNSIKLSLLIFKKHNISDFLNQQSLLGKFINRENK